MKKATQQQTKEHNRNLVFKTILEQEFISRADIARTTRLTRTTVSDIVTELMQEGLVEEVGLGTSRGGKSPILLSVVEDSRTIIGLDIAQNRFSGAVVNLCGKSRETKSLPVDERDGDEALGLVYEILDPLVESAGNSLVGIGVGTPGLVNTREGVVINAVNLDWNDLPLAKLMRERYNLPVCVLNDSQAAAMGEYVYGKGSDERRNLIVINARHGIGAGIVIDGQLFQGDGGGAGEIGHVVVVMEDGLLCRCGNYGCLETVASAQAIVKRMRQLEGGPVGVGAITLETVESAFAAGDPLARQVVLEAGSYMGLAISGLVGLLNIQNIVLSGELTRFGTPWLEAIRNTMMKTSLPGIAGNTRVEIGNLDRNGIILELQRFYLRIIPCYSIININHKDHQKHLRLPMAMKDESFTLIKPKHVPPLDDGFRPAVLAKHTFEREVAGEGVPLVLALERDSNKISHYEMKVYPQDHPLAHSSLQYTERVVKFLLWQRGGYKLYVGGPAYIGEYLRTCYSPQGVRQFDSRFMGELVYEQPFTVVLCHPIDVPPAYESGRTLGGYLDGCRIGFDLGASDRKVSALIDGQVIYSEEVIWEPRIQKDPQYHYREITTALKTAASKLPRVDAIGGSSAGIYIDNRPMVASLFRGIPGEQYHQIKNLFLRIREEMGVPLEVINDGDVTALAGAMSLEDNGVLGLALGSSEAAGYVDTNGHILGWLNELAFAPVDYSPNAPVDEWSGDTGCGSMYFSQQCVFRLAPRAGINIPQDIPDAEKLGFVQEKLEAGHPGAINIWESIGIYLGYALAHYADFYNIKHVLVLGRCTSGRGGMLLLEGANAVLRSEFSELAARMHVQLPDERSRRVGQSIAAASLPAVVVKE